MLKKFIVAVAIIISFAAPKANAEAIITVGLAAGITGLTTVSSIIGNSESNILRKDIQDEENAELQILLPIKKKK